MGNGLKIGMIVGLCVVVVAGVLVFALTRGRVYTVDKAKSAFPLQAGSMTLSVRDIPNQPVMTSATPGCSYVPELVFSSTSYHDDLRDRFIAAPQNASQPVVRVDVYRGRNKNPDTQDLRDEAAACASFSTTGDRQAKISVLPQPDPPGLGDRLEWAVVVDGTTYDLQFWSYRNLTVAIVGTDHTTVNAIGAQLKKKLPGA